jgi:hypothetical protein
MKLFPPPGPERRQQLRWLGVLLALLVAVLWYQWRQAETPPLSSNTQVPSPAATPTMKLPDTVRLDELEAVPETVAVGRNPFGFGERPAPPPPPTPVTPVWTPPPAAPPVPQGPPPIALKLTAMLVMPGTDRRMVTLKDPASGALYQAFEGDVVDGRYRVVKVGQQSVVLSYVDGSGLRTISLGG